MAARATSRSSPRRIRDRRLLAGTWLAVAVVVAAAGLLGAFRTSELALVDARFALRGTDAPDSRIALVTIDPATLTAAGSFPLPRRLHAELITRLKAAGARLVVEDVVFAEPGPDPAQDDALVRAIARAGNVVLAASETDAAGRPNVLGGLPLARVHATAGSANFGVDEHATIRRLRAAVDGLPTLAVAAAERLGHHVDRGALRGSGAPIDFAGPDGTYPAYSMARVLRGGVPASALRGRVVIVGATAPSLQDLHATPTSSTMAGAEVHANALSTVLRGLPLHTTPRGVAVLLVLLLAGIGPLASSRLGPRAALAATAGAGLAYAVIAQLAFSVLGLELVVVAPLVALGATIPLTLLASYVGAANELALERERHERELADARLRAAEARRVVERDLHDGAQQQLLALALHLGLTRKRLERGEPALSPEAVGAELATAATRVTGVVAELRALAHGEQPPMLADGGLDGGLMALADQSAGRVVLSGAVGRRLDPGLEGVGYFFVSEAVANALKHADASMIAIDVAFDGEAITISVRDDGRGGADPAGSGLLGLRDRVEAHGGEMDVGPAPGGGTEVTMRVPVAVSSAARSAAGPSHGGT